MTIVISPSLAIERLGHTQTANRQKHIPYCTVLDPWSRDFSRPYTSKGTDLTQYQTMDERTPLLQFPGTTTGQSTTAHLGDHHAQFCHLVGVRPHNLPPGQAHTPHPDSLYMRAIKHRRAQNATYAFTATLTNGMLLSQVVLGAALTALGASDSSRVLITVFGALNTVIAGLIAFLKSRGQPLRARMFRDDLDRVVDEIENSAVMWFGISRNAHGYDAIDTDDAVTVRSEVARLTRLYDRAVKTNTMNDPDMYAAGTPGDAAHNAALRARPGTGQIPAPPPPANPGVPLSAVTAPVAVDQDASPATKAPAPPPPQSAPPAPEPTPSETKPDLHLVTSPPSKPAAAPASPPTAPEANPGPPQTPVPPQQAPGNIDESPATSAHPPTRSNTEPVNRLEAVKEGEDEEGKKDSMDPHANGEEKGGEGSSSA